VFLFNPILRPFLFRCAYRSLLRDLSPWKARELFPPSPQKYFPSVPPLWSSLYRLIGAPLLSVIFLALTREGFFLPPAARFCPLLGVTVQNFSSFRRGVDDCLLSFAKIVPFRGVGGGTTFSWALPFFLHCRFMPPLAGFLPPSFGALFLQ